MPEIDFGKRRSSVCRRPWARLPEPRRPGRPSPGDTRFRRHVARRAPLAV